MADVIRLPQRLDLGRPWTPTRVSDILELPPAPKWLWDSRIRRKEVTILGGAEKVGKSLLMQQLLSCAALGVPCLGRHTDRCRAFGYFCEDTQDDLTIRQFDINAALGVSMPAFRLKRADGGYDDMLNWQSMVGKDCILADFEYGKMKLTGEWDHLWRVIEDEGAELVTIDTGRTVFGGNEREPRQVTPFMRELHKKAIEHEIAIILALHPPTGNVEKGYAGTGAWLGSARAGLSLERPAGYDMLTDTPRFDRVLRGIGANYSGGRAVAKIKFDLDRKVFVADEPDETPPPRADSPGRRDVLAEELDRVVWLNRNNGAKIRADVLHPHSAPNYYRKTFDKRTSSNDLYDAQNDLIAKRRWLRVRVGGECLLRPADGAKYEGEESWSI